MRFTSLSLNAIRSSKAYEFEEKLIQKDTIGAIDKITEFQPTSEMESFHKTTKEIYSHSWLINKSSLSIEDSLALYSIAYQSPRVSGNAVYQARAMLGLIILDTETYSAKSAQLTNADNIESESNLKLYPNPATELIQYEFDIEEMEKGNIKIYNILGSVLEEINVNHKISKGSIDLTKFSKGVYLFELNIFGKHKITKQFVVN